MLTEPFDQHTKLDAPLFVTWFQCVVTVGLCIVISLVSKRYPNKIQFPDWSIDFKIARDVIDFMITISKKSQIYRFFNLQDSTVVICICWHDRIQQPMSEACFGFVLYGCSVFK
jgi:hypothetical protein